MSSSRSAVGATKPRPHNVNSVYSGRNAAAGKASGPSKHGGLQTLGKAPAVVRRMPPPATLPSLKAEHGQDPNVILVPQGGSGWSKSTESTQDTKSGATESVNASGGGPDLRPNWAKPVQAPSTLMDQVSAPSHTTSAAAANNREFPTLAASVAKKANSAGIVENKLQNVTSWPESGASSPEVPMIPVAQVPPPTGYIGASGPKNNVERKLPERYYGGPTGPRPTTATKKYDIKEKLAQLSVESKEPPTEVGQVNATAGIASNSEETSVRSQTASEESPVTVFHPPDFSQPPPSFAMAPPQPSTALSAPKPLQANVASQDVRQYMPSHAQQQPPVTHSHSTPPSTEAWSFENEERLRGAAPTQPSGHGDTGYAYPQPAPHSFARHRYAGPPDKEFSSQPYDAHPPGGAYDSSRYEEKGRYGNQTNNGERNFDHHPLTHLHQQGGDWTEDMNKRTERSTYPHQRYPSETHGATPNEFDSSWNGPLDPRQASYGANGPRRSDVGWNDVRPPSYPPPLLDTSMDNRSTSTNYNSRSRTSSYNTSAVEETFGGTNLGPVRETAVDKSRQKRRTGNEPSSESDIIHGAGDTTDTSRYTPDRATPQKEHNRRSNDKGNQRTRGTSQKMPQSVNAEQQPAYRMLKRNDEKSAAYLANHGGNFITPMENAEGDNEEIEAKTRKPANNRRGPESTQRGSTTHYSEERHVPKEGKERHMGNRGQRPNAGNTSNYPNTADINKPPKVTNRMNEPKSSGGAVPPPPAPPPPENVWAKRMEERNSAEREKTPQKPRHMDYHFPSLSEAEKAEALLNATPQEELFAAKQKSQRQDSRHQSEQQSHRRGQQAPRHPRTQWNESRQDDNFHAERSVDKGDLEGRDNESYEGTKREFFNSRRGVSRTKTGVGHGVGLAGRVKRLGMARDTLRPAAGSTSRQNLDDGLRVDAPSGEPEDNFSNMGEFHAEDYVPEQNRGKAPEGDNERSEPNGSSFEHAARRGKRRGVGRQKPMPRETKDGLSRNGPTTGRNWQRGGKPRDGTRRDSLPLAGTNGTEEVAFQSGQTTIEGKSRDGGRQKQFGSANGFSQQTVKAPRRRIENVRTKKPRTITDRGTQLKSPVISEGAGEEWETASESSDFAERSVGKTNATQPPLEKDRKKPSKPLGRSYAANRRSSNAANGVPRDSNGTSLGGSNKDIQSRPHKLAGQKNVKPASHTYQDRSVFGKNSSVNNKAVTNNRTKTDQNRPEDSAANEQKTARGIRRDSAPQTSGNSSVNVGLAGVDINDASVIVIDDYPDVLRSETHSESGDFEEVLSKKSKKIRQQVLEEERKKEQREKERQERANARKSKMVQMKAQRTGKKGNDKRHTAKSAKETTEQADADKDLSGILLNKVTAQQDDHKAASNQTTNSVWNSAEVAISKPEGIEKLATKAIPSPIARPTPKTSASENKKPPESIQMMESTSKEHGPPEKEPKGSSEFNFTYDPSLPINNTNSQVATSEIRNHNGKVKSSVTYEKSRNVVLPQVPTNSDHVQLQAKLDKVKDFWSGQTERGAAAILVPETSTLAITEKAFANNASLSQAHGPNVAKVKPQPQLSTSDHSHGQRHQSHQPVYSSANDGGKPTTDTSRPSNVNGEHSSAYLATSHMAGTPQSPINTAFLGQNGNAMFGLAGISSTVGAGAHNPLGSFPPYSILLSGGEFIPQTFAPQMPANSPPSQYFGQNNAFAARPRPNSFIDHPPTMFMAPPPPHNTGHMSAAQQQMPLANNPMFGGNGGILYGNGGGAFPTGRYPQQPPYMASMMNNGADYSSQPPSRPSTAISASGVPNSNSGGYTSHPQQRPSSNSTSGMFHTPTNFSAPPPPIGKSLTAAMPPTHLPPPNVRPQSYMAGPSPQFEFNMHIPPPNLGPVGSQRNVPSKQLNYFK